MASQHPQASPPPSRACLPARSPRERPGSVSPESTPKFVIKRLLNQQLKSHERDPLPKWQILRLTRTVWTLFITNIDVAADPSR